MHDMMLLGYSVDANERDHERLTLKQLQRQPRRRGQVLVNKRDTK
jgi:hypothetical protein